MTVKELIKALSDMDQDTEVKFAYNYGDYWNTEVAASIEAVDEGEVTHSGYHRMDKTVDSDDDRYDEVDREDFRTVVILR
jgi:hypothetical protein